MWGGVVSVLHLQADARSIPLGDDTVDMIATSPPYFGLRDYGVDGQIGAEVRPDCLGWASGVTCGGCFVCAIRCVASEMRRVLKPSGVLWLNLGDSYAGSWGNQGRKETRGGQRPVNGGMIQKVSAADAVYQNQRRTGSWVNDEKHLKSKDLIGVPWRVALALQADGWWLRSDIIWAKPNPMPSSVKDRCTTSHEHVFMLTKSPRYYFDAGAIREQSGGKPSGSGFAGRQGGAPQRVASGGAGSVEPWRPGSGRNKRDVWTCPTASFKGAHFAVWPERLVEPMILAGCPPGGVVLDPFGGSGTTARVAASLGRRAVSMDLRREYCEMQQKRATGVQVALPLGHAS